MSISKVQTGDSVKVISGKFKGTLGKVTKVIKGSKNKGSRVSIDNVNKLIKFTKSNKTYGVQGKMVQIDRFLDSSNVSLVDDNNIISKTFISMQNNKKTRFYRSTNTAVHKILNITEKTIKTKIK